MVAGGLGRNAVQRGGTGTAAWGPLLVVAAAGTAIGLVVAVAPVAALVVVIAAVAAVAFLRAPGVLFGAYLLIPFYKGAAQGYSPIDLTVALAVLNALQLAVVVRSRSRPPVPRAGLLLLAALTLLILGGVLYAPDQGLALTRFVNWALLVVIPILGGTLRVASEPRFVRQLIWTFFWAGVGVTVIGLAALSSTRRLEVLGANTIAVAMSALLVPLLAVAWVFRTRAPLPVLVAVIATPAAFVVAVASGSRGPVLFLVIAAIAAVAGLLVLRRRVHRSVVLGVASIAVVSAAVFGVTATQLPPESLQRFQTFGEFVQGNLLGDVTSSVDPSSAARADLFDLAGQLFGEHPILGVGTAGYAALSPAALGPNADAYPHNAVLQFAAEFGVVGLLVFGSLAVLALVGSGRSPGIGVVRLLFLWFFLNALTTGDVFDSRAMWGTLVLAVVLGAVARPPDAFGARRTAPPPFDRATVRRRIGDIRRAPAPAATPTAARASE